MCDTVDEKIALNKPVATRRLEISQLHIIPARHPQFRIQGC